MLKLIQLNILIIFGLSGNAIAQGTLRQLDSMAVFSFSVMSDNKGYALENPHMRKCDRWIREEGDPFILGLGDHVKDNRKNPFLRLISHDSLWHNHFYPNVADGENEFWGTGQDDWGAGWPILDSAGLFQRKNVWIRNNKCEYYARETHSGITVHIIQLHYSDSPPYPDSAFREDSRQWLMDVLDSIKKDSDDIIIVLAHTGNWVNVLNKQRKAKVLEKADLILGATTHIFTRYEYPGHPPEKVALSLNTGAVGNSIDSGFLQVHVLKDPLRLIVQYQRTRFPARQLQAPLFSYEKIIGGPVRQIDWKSAE